MNHTIQVSLDQDALRQAIANQLRGIAAEISPAAPSVLTTPSTRFTRIGSQGQTLPADATGHVAVVDNLMGVMYGLRNLGGTEGRPQRDIVEEAKAVDLLGHRDWTLWTPHQAFAIVRHDRYKPAVDSELFPCILPSWYWTGQDCDPAWSSASAFGVYFLNGYVYDGHRNYDGFGLPVRRVAGQ